MCTTLLTFLQLLLVQWIPIHGGDEIQFDNVACGINRPRIWNSEQGVVTSRNYPLDYPNNELCEWRFDAPIDMFIGIRFTEIDTQNGEDTVTVYDGRDSDAPVLGIWSGDVDVGNLPLLKSTGRYLFVRFMTGSSLVRQRGFRLEYQRLGIEEIPCTFGPLDFVNVTTGVLHSTYWPEPYERDATCSWRIFADSASKIIEVDLTHFQTHLGDVLTIYDGPSSSSDVITNMQGLATIPMPSFLSSQSAVTITWNTDANIVSRTGWRFLWHSFEDDAACHDDGLRIIRDGSGTINTRNFPDPYPANETCVWLIEAPVVYQVITFDVRIFDSYDETDQLIVYDGSSTNSPILMQASGESPDLFVVTSSGPSILVTFVTGPGITYNNGWTANFNMSDRCSDVYAECPQDAADGWCDRCSNYMNDFCRGSCDYCGKQDEKHRLLHSGDLFIEEACGPNRPKILGDAFGEIISRNFPEDYSPNEECTWRINAPPGEIINLDFTHFGLGNEMDNIAIYDDDRDFEGLLLARYYQGDTAESLVTSGNNMFIKFSTDEGATGLGFRAVFARYEDDTGCRPGRPRVINATIHEEGIVQSRNWPNFYPVNEYCEWLVEAHESDLLGYEFDFFSTRYCTDQVRIYDGRTVNDTLLQVSCGDIIPPVSTATSNTMLITFTASGEGSSNHEGFRGRYYVEKVCADWDPLCPVWTANGWCSRCPSYMSLNCEGSCGTCPRNES